MFFFFAFVIVAIACSTILIKTLVGYSDIKKIYKYVIAILIVAGWFAPLIIKLLEFMKLVPDFIYTPLYHFLYSLMGFCFILLALLLVRDIIWYTTYGICKLANKNSWHVDPNNLTSLNRANIVVVCLAVIATAYALYLGYKIPEIKNIAVYSDKIDKNLRILQISDLHINRATAVDRIKAIVNEANNLNPDVIVLTGDTIDDNVVLIEEQMGALKELSAPYGVFAIMGNHEFYNNIYDAKRTFENNNFEFLFNGGKFVGNTNIYISGIPDMNTMYERINLWRTFAITKKDDYRVLLSHTPIIADSLSTDLVDLVLSGHTHGGQIYPFHLLVKHSNRYLAGVYEVNKLKLIVSRGAGTWGPAMRLFAPSDIILIDLIKK